MAAQREAGAAGNVTICTAVGVDELALARALAGDLARVHPGWRLTVLVLDGEARADERFDSLTLGELDRDEPGLLEIVTHGPRQLAAALRPWLMAAVLERTPGTVVWLDATVRVFDALDPIVVAAGGGVALAPLHPLFEPARGLAARGPFESGMLAASAGGPLRWWGELVLDAARRAGAGFDPLAGRLLGALAAAGEEVAIVRERGLCAGWWTVAAGGALEGAPPRVDGVPLRAFNFAGFDPRRPHWLSSEDSAGRARVSSSPVLADLAAARAAGLIEAGWPDEPGPWHYASLPGGLTLDDDLRDLYAIARRESAALGDPFDGAGEARFLDWVDGESPIGAGVTHYLERVHRRRHDLQVAFPDLAGGDGVRLVAWMETHGHDEEPVLAALLDRRAAPQEGHSPPRARPAGAVGVRLVGYLGDGLGLGEAARSYAQALDAVGVSVETVSVPVPLNQEAAPGGLLPRRRKVAWDADPAAGAGWPAVEIVCINPPELLRLERAGLAQRDGGHRIGVWAWELDTMPADWEPAYALVDEVWVYSEHVAAALRDAPVPVSVMPLTVDVERLAAAGAGAERGDGPFTFLFAFDLLSSLERKNPLGLIEAFCSAFAPGEGPRLLLKTSNGDNHPEQLERLRFAARGRSDVEIVDEFVPAAERDALIAGCDCYVSLHRAEGFGLTIAEAMAAGRPAIATGCSGNLDFMDADSGYLVDWRPVEVERGSLLYPAGSHWAEPDLGHAAALMRAVYEDPAAAAARGRAGAERVRRQLEPAAVGSRLRERIERIAAAHGGRSGRLRSPFRRRSGS